MEFNCTLKSDGKLIVHRRSAMDNWLASLASDNDQAFVLTIEKRKRKRSDGLNRYWWGVVVPVVQRGLNDLGHDLNKEETHEFLMTNFGYKEIVNEETGEVLRVPGRSSKMTGSEMWEVIDKVVGFAAEHLHETIAMPNEQAIIDFNNSQE